MKHIEKTCKHCQSTFTVLLKRHTAGKAVFCSRSCASLYKGAQKPTPKPNLTCSICYKAFYRSNSKHKSKSGFYFCSRTCKARAQKLGSGFETMLPSHYGTDCHYRKLAFDNYAHECAECQWNRYPEILEVHHIDGNKNNNELANLEIVCPTCHKVLHFLSKTGIYGCKKSVLGTGVEPA